MGTTANEGARMTSSGGLKPKRNHEVKQSFLIDLKEYGGTIEIAKDKIKTMCKESLVKTNVLEGIKVKIKPHTSELYKVDISIRTILKK